MKELEEQEPFTINCSNSKSLTENENMSDANDIEDYLRTSFLGIAKEQEEEIQSISLEKKITDLGRIDEKLEELFNEYYFYEPSKGKDEGR